MQKQAIPPPLLSPEFVGQLCALQGALFWRRKQGELRGGGFGQAPEFDAHRPYDPGDDPRYIDWKIFARLEKILLKLFTRDDESQVSVLVDTSLSMRADGQRKLALAARFAAAFSYLTLSAGRYLMIGAFSDTLLSTRGPYRSLLQFTPCLQFFNRLPPGEKTHLGRSLGEFLSHGRGKRRGYIFIVSDFFQERDVVQELDWLRWRKEDLHLVQIVDDAELEPQLRGDCAVSDLEGSETLLLTMGDDLLSEFRRRIREYHRELETVCRSRSIPYLMARTSQNFEELFLNHLLRAPSRGTGA